MKYLIVGCISALLTVAAPSILAACGKVKWFNSIEGYGFIAPENGGKNVFVHITQLNMSGIHTLKTEEQVCYTTKINANEEAYATEITIIKK